MKDGEPPWSLSLDFGNSVVGLNNLRNTAQCDTWAHSSVVSSLSAHITAAVLWPRARKGHDKPQPFPLRQHQWAAISLSQPHPSQLSEEEACYQGL